MLEEKSAAKHTAAASKHHPVLEVQDFCSGCFCQGKALHPGTPLLKAKSIPRAGCQLLKGSCHVFSCNP